MQDQIRNTGKFRPVQYVISHNFTTTSTIKVPQYLPNLKPKNIQWRRKCQDLLQKLHHLDGSFQYPCTQLDKDCIIQAIIESQLSNGNIDMRINVYGPITLSNQLNFLLDNINNQGETIQIQIISHNKNYSCFLVFSGIQLILKNKNLINNQLIISLNDTINTFVQKINGVDVVTFPTVFLRIVGLKLFNQIISKGTYSDNNDPLLIKIFDHQDNNPKIRTNTKWKRLLLKLNNVKQDKARRMSMPQVVPNSNINNKTVMPVIDVQLKKSPDARYSEDVCSTPLSDNKYKQQSMKKSETFQRNNTNATIAKKNSFRQSESDLVQSDNPYLMEFQNLIYEENDEPDKDAIALNSSFEEFQKKSRSQKQIQKLEYVKAKKKQRDAQNYRTKKLKQKLQSILAQRDQLLTVNSKLKQDIEKAQHQKNQNYVAQIAASKSLISELKAQYQWLLEQAARRNDEQRKSLHRLDKSSKLQQF